METRHIVAYALIAIVAVGGLVGGILLQRRRAARKRRLRGIKTDEIARAKARRTT